MTAVELDLTELETDDEVGGNSDERGGRRKGAKLAVLIVDRQVICLMSMINLAYRSYHVSNVVYRYRSTVGFSSVCLLVNMMVSAWIWCLSSLLWPLAALRPRSGGAEPP